MGKTKRSIITLAIASLVALAIACGTETIVEVPVVKEVEVPVETIVEKEVIKEVPVDKIVEVEKIVTETIEVPVEVIVEAPAKVTPAGPNIYTMGIFEEPVTRNFWSYFGGPGSTVWTGYVLEGNATTLYDYSDQRFDWIPELADGFPTALTAETVGEKEFWTTTVNLKDGAKWSDGVEITADDMAFVVDTVLDMELTGGWQQSIDPGFVDHIEAVDSKTAKIFFNAQDAEGNPQKPGLSVWQFGLGFMPILPKHYWGPVVAEAAQLDDVEAQQQQLFGFVPDGEPTAGGFTFTKWEPGAFYESTADENYYLKGATITQYDNGAWQQVNPTLDYDVTYFGEAEGPTTLELTVGPHTEGQLFNIYTNQDTAILALESGDVDYVFNPNGLERGFEDRVRDASDLDLITNASNNVRYLGFNLRKAPMSNLAFRQAVALVIDKEFVTNSILQGASVPAYAMVPSGNGFWHNADVPKLGQSMSRTDRVGQAVQILKDAGFTYQVEPVVGDDDNFVEVRGQGLLMPDGTPVPELQLLGTGAGYDPMRSTFAVWVERWLNDIGIPAQADLTGFNNMVGQLFDPAAGENLDMWILGWSLALFPGWMDGFFHTRHGEPGSGGWNFGGYSNQEFDALATQLLVETDLNNAQTLVHDMQAFLADDLPYVTLFSSTISDTFRPSRIKFPYTDILDGIQGSSGFQRRVLIQ
ncbi:MAG: ABC transporter substrate-binding protein [SAR202 cluster bacterium]|nr:ABC transporter substrate-binding protein [SAR202 cluster bacterium]